MWVKNQTSAPNGSNSKEKTVHFHEPPSKLGRQRPGELAASPPWQTLNPGEDRHPPGRTELGPVKQARDSCPERVKSVCTSAWGPRTGERGSGQVIGADVGKVLSLTGRQDDAKSALARALSADKWEETARITDTGTGEHVRDGPCPARQGEGTYSRGPGTRMLEEASESSL